MAELQEDEDTRRCAAIIDLLVVDLFCCIGMSSSILFDLVIDERYSSSYSPRKASTESKAGCKTDRISEALVLVVITAD